VRRVDQQDLEPLGYVAQVVKTGRQHTPMDSIVTCLTLVLYQPRQATTMSAGDALLVSSTQGGRSRP